MNILFQVAPLTLLSPPQFSLQIQFSFLGSTGHFTGKMSAPQRKKFHTDDLNQCLHN